MIYKRRFIHQRRGLLSFPVYYLLFILGMVKMWYILDLNNFDRNSSDLPKPISFVQSSYYAVMGSDDNPVYLFPLLITVKRWKSLGVRSIVCFGSAQDKIERNSASNYVYRELLKEQVQILFLNSTMAPVHTISQTCRLFVSSSSSLNINDDDVIITSDSDWWPRKLENHVPQPGQRMFAYASHCCGFTHKPWSLHWFRHYRLSTLAMSARTWRQLMEIPLGWLENGNTLARRLYDEFGVKFIRYGRGKPFISKSWFADQILASEKIDHWKAKGYLKDEDFGEVQVIANEDRMWRDDGWPEDFSKVDLSRIREFHLLSPLHEPENWNLTLPLLKKLFNAETLEELHRYYETFNRIFNSTHEKNEQTLDRKRN